MFTYRIGFIQNSDRIRAKRMEIQRFMVTNKLECPRKTIKRTTAVGTVSVLKCKTLFLRTNYMVLVRKRTTLTERPLLVSEIYCQVLWIEGCRMVSAADPPQLLKLSFLGWSRYFLSSSSSFIFMRLSGPHSRPTATQKIL
jgi:hypothetical protein